MSIVGSVVNNTNCLLLLFDQFLYNTRRCTAPYLNRINKMRVRRTGLTVSRGVDSSPQFSTQLSSSKFSQREL
jgi:hypothetical protein